MKLKQLFTDDDAVSPVIGVILMVAITVILAAVIATFVIGLGDSAGNNSPSASFDIEYTEDSAFTTSSNGYVEISHQSGDSIQADELEVSGDNIYEEDDGSWEEQYSDSAGTTTDYDASSSISSGDSIYVGADSGFDIALIWSPPEEDTSNELQSETGPDA